jgi:hypothetical protein
MKFVAFVHHEQVFFDSRCDLVKACKRPKEESLCSRRVGRAKRAFLGPR